VCGEKTEVRQASEHTKESARALHGSEGYQVLRLLWGSSSLSREGQDEARFNISAEAGGVCIISRNVRKREDGEECIGKKRKTERTEKVHQNHVFTKTTWSDSIYSTCEAE